MIIAVLDFASSSVDTIHVSKAFIDKYYGGEVEEFLNLWCGYPTANCQWMIGEEGKIQENFNLTINDFGGDDELNISKKEIEQSSINFKTDLKDVMNIYSQSEVCMGETLGHIPANGLTIEEAFELYTKAMNYAEGDEFYRKEYDSEITNLTK